MILVTTTGKVGSEASRLLAKRGVPVRVLAHHPGNNSCMQNFLTLAPAIASSGSFASCTGDGRLGMIDTRFEQFVTDYAAAFS